MSKLIIGKIGFSNGQTTINPRCDYCAESIGFMSLADAVIAKSYPRGILCPACRQRLCMSCHSIVEEHRIHEVSKTTQGKAVRACDLCLSSCTYLTTLDDLYDGLSGYNGGGQYE